MRYYARRQHVYKGDMGKTRWSEKKDSFRTQAFHWVIMRRFDVQSSVGLHKISNLRKSRRPGVKINMSLLYGSYLKV